MGNTDIPGTTYNYLIQHIVDMEDEKSNAINEFYPDETIEKKEFENLIMDYISNIEKFLKKTSKVEQMGTQPPFVTIGSIIEIKEADSGETSKIQIVSPFYNKVGLDADCASYMSPVGRAMLLKKVNDKVKVSTPIGEFSYIVKSIEIPEE